FILYYRLRRADGEYRWVADHGTPRNDEQGKFAGYIGSCVDVTETRLQHEALTESEARLRAILDNAVDCIITIDQRGTTESVNTAAEATFGYRAEEMIGRNVKMILPLLFSEEHDRYLSNFL